MKILRIVHLLILILISVSLGDGDSIMYLEVGEYESQTETHTLTYTDWITFGGGSSNWYVNLNVESYNVNIGEGFNVEVKKNGNVIDYIYIAYNGGPSSYFESYSAAIGDVFYVKVTYDFIVGFRNSTYSANCIAELN